jgi:MFS family permease
MSYVRDLSDELAHVGISGRLHRRILAEIGDHLACDPDADLGRPADLACQFADELGTRRARRAAFASFSALAIAGLAFAVAFLSSGSAGPNATRVYASSALLGYAGTALVLLAPQLALVAGSLAAMRAFQRRRERIITKPEATIIGRRTAVALGSGLAAMAGLLLVAIEFKGQLAGWWTSLTLGAAAVGSGAIALAMPGVFSALRLRPVATGPPCDLFDDLDGLVPARLDGRPWVFAFAVAAAIGVVVTLAGVLQADPIDGALRGLAEAIACLLGFAALGPYLGLRTVRRESIDPPPL